MLKHGMNMTSTHKTSESGVVLLMSVIRSIANPWVFLGFACYGVSSIIWLMILKKIPLSTAYPMISFSYVVVVLLSSLILKERVSWPVTVAGLTLIIGGVSLIGLGMVKPGGN
jgi:multidrug transporter EmrE-like cation transporter